MNLALPPPRQQFVAERVTMGRTASAVDVIQEARRLLQADEEEQAQRLAALRAEIVVRSRLVGARRGDTRRPRIREAARSLGVSLRLVSEFLVSPQAAHERADIQRSIDADNPAAARTLIASFEATVIMLVAHPEAGRM